MQSAQMSGHTLTLVCCLLAASAPAHSRPAKGEEGRAIEMVAAACPTAESEEVEKCAYGLVEQIDSRIEKTLCNARPIDCAVTFAAFKSHRDGVTQAYLSAFEDSVTARVEASLFALTLTSNFEREIARR
jgi:hypothetical protein